MFGRKAIMVNINSGTDRTYRGQRGRNMEHTFNDHGDEKPFEEQRYDNRKGL